MRFRFEAAPEPPVTTPFEVGATYEARTDRRVWEFTVVRRTAKFVTITGTDLPQPKRVRVEVGLDGQEYTIPLGRYPGRPTLYAGSGFGDSP